MVEIAFTKTKLMDHSRQMINKKNLVINGIFNQLN
jgi:hypothetical protein